MILKISRGGRIVRTSHDAPDQDISEKAIEYLFEGVELDQEVTLKDILLILKRNPILCQVFGRRRAVEILEDAFAGPAVEVPGYGVENMEYLELNWGWPPGGGDVFTIWRKMSMDGIGYALREPLQTDYRDFPAGSRRDWSLMFCVPRELVNYPLRINSKIRMEPGCCPKVIDLGLPDLGKVIEGALYCLSWFGSEADREKTKTEILKASAENAFYEVDADELIAELKMMIARIDEEDKN
jgi:hypothetical protein